MSTKSFDAARAGKRALALTATAALAVTGAAFGSAATANADAPTTPPSSLTAPLDSLSTWGQTATPSDFDYALSNGKLRYSNDLANPNLYGALAQLNTPVVQEAGETTVADNNTFTEEFTVGAESYNAQPGLAIEVDPSDGGNRAGGNLLLREDSDHTLSLATFYVPEGSATDNLEDWKNETADVDFTKPVDVKYVDHFVTGGQDIVKVYVNGDLKLSGSTFEGYHDLQEGDKEGVNSILFRTAYRKADPSGFGWTEETPTADQQTALHGKGFDFTNIKLASSNTVTVPTATAKKIQVSDIGLEGESYPSNTVFVGAPPQGETAGTPTFAAGKLVVPATTQVLHGYPTDARPTDLTGLIDSGLSWNQDGTGTTGAFFQIPLTYGDGNQFTTLRPATVTDGDNTANWGDQWVSSHGGVTGTLGQLVSTIEKAGNVHVFGFGVYAQNETNVGSFQAGSTKYTFADDPAITVNSVTISGTPQVGKTLTANVDASATTGITTTYQWYEGSTKLTTNATGATYTIPAARLGETLKVKVTVSKTGELPGSGTSASTSKVVAATFVAPAVTVTGTSAVGKTLTAVVASTPTATGVTYSWYRNGTKISGATKSTYTLTGSDFGQKVHVHAVLSKSGYTSAAVSSTDAAVASGGFSLGNAKITGTLTVGKTLTGSAIASITGTTKSYTWSIEAADGSFSILAISSSSKFKIPAVAKGSKIVLFVTAFKTGYESESSDIETATAVK